MLSKEEIEKAKEELNNYIIIINKTKDTENEWHGYYNNELHELKRDIETLLQYIDQLEADNYECNNIIKDYIAERNNLIDKMKADRMEQFDDYVIYLIEKYLKELGALEDE